MASSCTLIPEMMPCSRRAGGYRALCESDVHRGCFRFSGQKMKPLIDLLALFIGVLLAYIIQNFLPPMADLHGAHVLLVPMVFCYAAMILPFPAMLAAAIFTGFLSDLLYLHVVAGKG